MGLSGTAFGATASTSSAPSSPGPVAGRADPGERRRWGTDPVVWTAALFLVTFLTQRVAIPGLPIPITVPLAMGWLVLVLKFDVVELNRPRLLLWLSASGLSGMLVIVQMVELKNPYVSFNSWALWIVTWLPLVVSLRRRDMASYLRFARVTAHIGVGLAVLSLLFIGSQLAGLSYYDWFARVVPDSLVVKGYAISYPIVYGSSLYKSNGWIALEPSFMSFFLGVSLMCALVARVRVVWVLVLAAGLLCTVAGSGIALVLVFLVVLGLQGKLGSLRRYLVPGLVATVLFGSTFLGEAITSRVSEAGQQNSSTSLRSIEPYIHLWPYWISDPVGIFVGHGSGSSANLVAGLGIEGLLVPSVAKMLYDYGLVAGILLIALMASTFLRGPSLAIAVSLAASMFLLQGASQPLAICCMVAVSLWAPTPRDAGDAADALRQSSRSIRGIHP